jgi:hypothetical protein
MAVSYTNRNGRTYYLCQGLTKKGNPRYYFTKQAKGNVLDEIPEGYEIRESVNGKVSLVKARPIELLDSEISAVRSTLRKHPKAESCREDIKPLQITIYESMEPDIDQLMPILKEAVGTDQDKKELAGHIQEQLRSSGQFTPVLRFTLSDKQNRLFDAERMCYRGGIEDWINIAFDKPIDDLASRLIPALGTQDFFELI